MASIWFWVIRGRGQQVASPRPRHRPGDGAIVGIGPDDDHLLVLEIVGAVVLDDEWRRATSLGHRQKIVTLGNVVDDQAGVLGVGTVRPRHEPEESLYGKRNRRV